MRINAKFQITIYSSIELLFFFSVFPQNDMVACLPACLNKSSVAINTIELEKVFAMKGEKVYL